MVARSRHGDLRPFPVAETKHKDSILMTTEVPANVSYHVLEAARKLALDAVSLLDGVPAEMTWSLPVWTLAAVQLCMLHEVYTSCCHEHGSNGPAAGR